MFYSIVAIYLAAIDFLGSFMSIDGRLDILATGFGALTSSIPLKL